MTSLYCPSWPPDHTRVSFTDWKTLLGPEKVLLTSCAPMPIIHSLMTLLSTSRPLQPKVNVCHTHSSFIMPCFMDGLILKHSLCMWAFMCPSAALSHTLFLLKGPEIPISDFPRILGCLSNSPLCQAPSNSTHLARSLPPVTPQLFETCQ